MKQKGTGESNAKYSMQQLTQIQWKSKNGTKHIGKHNYGKQDYRKHKHSSRNARIREWEQPSRPQRNNPPREQKTKYTSDQLKANRSEKQTNMKTTYQQIKTEGETANTASRKTTKSDYRTRSAGDIEQSADDNYAASRREADSDEAIRIKTIDEPHSSTDKRKKKKRTRKEETCGHKILQTRTKQRRQ